MANMTRNIPLSLDEDLLAEIDRLVESTKESRSAVMRRAIREGLPVMKSGGTADVVTLDGVTSRDVNRCAEEGKVSREKVLIEAIQMGLQAAYCKMMRDKWTREQDQNPKDAEHWIHTFEHQLEIEDPRGQQLRAALRQRGAALLRLHDLLDHVPEALHRYQAAEKLNELRRRPGGVGVGVFGSGISTPEIEWQIQMTEKYGAGPLPEHEIQAREAARTNEDNSQRKSAFDYYSKRPHPDF